MDLTNTQGPTSSTDLRVEELKALLTKSPARKSRDEEFCFEGFVFVCGFGFEGVMHLRPLSVDSFLLFALRLTTGDR